MHLHRITSVVTAVLAGMLFAPSPQACPERSRRAPAWGEFPLEAKPSAQQPKAPPLNKARDLIEQAVAALGGPAYLEVTTLVRQGRYYSFSRSELSGADVFTDYLVLPDKERFELGKKRNIIYVNNGNQGWELDQQGIRDQTPEAIARFQNDAQRDIELLLRRRRTEPGVQFYYQGSRLVANRRVDLIEMVDAENETYLFYLDAQTHLPSQLRYRERDTLTGEVVEVIYSYGNYFQVQGIQTPLQLTRVRAGRKDYEVFLTKVEYSTEIPDDLFTRDSLEARWLELSKKRKKKKDEEEEEPSPRPPTSP